MDTLLREDLNSPLSVSMTLGVINILFDEFPSFVCRGVAFDLCKETPPPPKKNKNNVTIGRHATAVQELGRASDFFLIHFYFRILNRLAQLNYQF